MAKSNLHAVPSDDAAKPQRAQITSFRIPTYWYKKAQDEARRLDISITQVYMRALTQYFEFLKEGESSWDVIDDEDGYSLSRFYTRSEDKKGHSFQTPRVGIPKPLAGEINSLIQSGVVPPWRSIGDVIRDSLYHRLKWMGKAIDNAELEQTVDMAMLLAEEMQLMDEAEHVGELISAMRENAQGMIARDATPARVKKYLAQRREIADQIPEAYRREYLEAVEDFEKRVSRVSKKRNPRKK